MWARKDWPEFTRRDSEILPVLSAARLKQGKLLGSMSRLGFDVNVLAQLSALTEDAVKTSEIEGEVLDRADVRSSLARRLGVEEAAANPADAKVEGVVEMLLDATQNFDKPLTKKRLSAWHAALFPTGYSGIHKVRTGKWRTDADGPMQVISGAIGKERIHFVAAPAARVENEIQIFLAWFNGRVEPDGLLRAAMAHLWFVTIHPFEDGNGRIARAITDMALAQSEDSAQRFYSMSGQIRTERKAYYNILEQTQKGSLDVTPWLLWFLECFGRAIDGAGTVCGAALRKAEFWQTHDGSTFNDRQRKVLNLWLDGMDGNLTVPKWAKLTKTSMATAQRDVADLVERGVLRRGPGGSKNSNYDVVER